MFDLRTNRDVSGNEIGSTLGAIYKSNNGGFSFGEVMGIAESELSTTWWFPWYDATSPSFNWIMVSNPNSKPVVVEISIAGTKTSDSPHTIPAGDVWAAEYHETLGGPVKVASTDGQKIFASQRTHRNDVGVQAINVKAISDPELALKSPFSSQTGLANSWWFPWYDAVRPTMNWILVGNPGPHPAIVEIYIGYDRTSDSPNTIPVGGVWTPEYPGVVKGPVRVVSTNGQQIFVSQRSLRSDTKGFNEIMGVPKEQLARIWWFPWYDSTSPSLNWIMVANPNSIPAIVEITIAGNKTSDSPHTIPAGEVWVPRYADVMGGPVKVMSTNGQKILVSQRSLRAQGFGEVIGVTESQLSTNWWFPWYDSQGEAMNWIMVGNPGTGPAIVEIYIAGTKTSDSPYIIPANGLWKPKYDGIKNGPVKVVSLNGQKIFVSQRTHRSSTSGFNEVMGIAEVMDDVTTYLIYLPLTVK